MWVHVHVWCLLLLTVRENKNRKTVDCNIDVSAPMNDAMDEENNEFYNQSSDTISSCNWHNMIVVIHVGDLNAKIGINNTNREELMGKRSMK